MSYSFSVRAATKELVLDEVAKKLDEVVKNFPEHAKDRDQAMAAACGMVGVMHVDDARDLCMSVSGWMTTADSNVVGAAVSVSCTLQPR